MICKHSKSAVVSPTQLSRPCEHLSQTDSSIWVPEPSISIFRASVDLVLFKHSAALPVWLTMSRNLQIESKVHCLRNSALLSFKKPPAPKCVQESRRNKQSSLTLYPSPPAYTVPTVSNSHHKTNIKVQIQELEECPYNCNIFEQLKLLDYVVSFTVI